MADSGIQRIDELLAGTGAPLKPGEHDTNPTVEEGPVGAVQDLLRGHGFRRLPGLRDASRGKFGKGTEKAIRAFRKDHGLPDSAEIDQRLLEELIDAPASSPIASQAYVTLVLDIAFTGLAKLVSLVAIVEGAGKFGALCKNTDKAGLSVGIIQWAQRPLRLAELLRAFQADQATTSEAIFGGAAVLSSLIAHTEKVDAANKIKGGVKEIGETTDPKFNLIVEPWITRFRQASLHRDLQIVQMTTAAAAFQKSANNIKNKMPLLKSEREVAFGLDLANQFGDGGAKSIYDACAGAANLLEAMRDESVTRLKNNPKFKKQPSIPAAAKDRRDFFIKTERLSNDPFPFPP